MEVDLIFKIAAIGIVVAIINQLLNRVDKQEYSTVITIAGIIAVLLMIVPKISSFFETVKSAFGF